MIRPVFSVVLALALIGSLPAHGADIQASGTALLGRVYPAAASNAVPAFTVERSVKTTGETRVLSERFKDKEGKTAALLESTYVAGVLQLIAFEQFQSGESATAAFKDGRVFYTQTESGRTKTSDEAVTGLWIPLSAVPEEIARNWDALTGGKPLEFAMPVPVMRDHFNFTVARQRSWIDNRRRLTEFKMQPTSLLIRMMADDFYYVFDDERRALVEYRGVTIAKTNDNGKLKDLKARITYAPASLAGQ